MSQTKNDFSEGKVWVNIVRLAVPMTLAQMVQILYNVVDRMYIGHLPENSGNAITGLGVTLPVIMIITAFTQLVSMGGAPLCSIERGRGDTKTAEKLLGYSFTLLIFISVLLMAVFYIFMKPILTAFGASDVTYYYASGYLKIYLIGTVFSMLATGLNPFINLQGFAKTGMATMLIGAVVNIVLDPIFIFWFNLGIFGAAVATVISQILSAVWVLRFLTGKSAILTIKKENMRIKDFPLVRKILGLGMSGFIMAVTNSLTQIACNSVLQKYGGDVYVGVMALLCSVREMTTMIISGLNSGAQPVIGYNYGAGEYKRVKQGIFFIGAVGITYTFLVWLLIDNRPDIFIRMFTSDAEIVEKGIPALKVYFQGFFMMSLQFCGQSAFVALGRSKNAIFFSLFRKALIVVPLVYLLPLKFGVEGVFYSEPISNYIGCTACFVTMIIVVRKMLSGESSKNE